MGELPYQVPPPCIFCGHGDAEDVTPEDAATEERVFACRHCFRKFTVRFIPPLPPESRN